MHKDLVHFLLKITLDFGASVCYNVSTQKQIKERIMAILYKIDVLSALKSAGYSTTRIRNERIIGQSYLQQIRNGEIVSTSCLDKLCQLLNCQPGDLLKYEENE